MTTIHDLPTPALVLDLDMLESNLDYMATRARDLGVALRPHIKTHKCIEIAQRQVQHGARGITVSTLAEAEAFADGGFDDILWAFPVIISRIPQARALAKRVRLGLVIDTLEAVAALREAGEKFEVHLKVDCGYHRAGVDPQSDYALEVARAIGAAPQLQFAGTVSHSGHAYTTAGRAAITDIAEEERSVAVAFAARLNGEGIDVPNISVGSTPAMVAAQSLEGVTEARPGNYALFDYSQAAMGSCTPKQCAATVVTSVVSAPNGSDHAVVDAGALALSKDPGPGDPFEPSMGEVYSDYQAGLLHDDLRLVGLSQEHGKLNRRVAAGTRLRVLPNHSCLTVASFDEFHVARGDEIVDTWKVWRHR